MTGVAKRTISLPIEHTAYIDRKVSSGDYASVSEVVRAGLRALQERDAAVEKWLRDEVADAYDAIKAEPGRAVALGDVMAELRARHRGKARA